jgi:hypothetical protein
MSLFDQIIFITKSNILNCQSRTLFTYVIFIGIHRSEVMVASNPDGVDKVENSNGKYAFFMESSSIEYLVERRCKLAQVFTRFLLCLRWNKFCIAGAAIGAASFLWSRSRNKMWLWLQFQWLRLRPLCSTPRIFFLQITLYEVDVKRSDLFFP